MTGVGAKRIFRRELKRFGESLNQPQSYGQLQSGTVEEAAEQLCPASRIPSTKTAADRASAFAGVSAPSSRNNFGGRVGDDACVEGRERTGKIEVVLRHRHSMCKTKPMSRW